MKLWHHVMDTLSMLLEGSTRPLLEPQSQGNILMRHVAVVSSLARCGPAMHVLHPSLALSIGVIHIKGQLLNRIKIDVIQLLSITMPSNCKLLCRPPPSCSPHWRGCGST